MVLDVPTETVSKTDAGALSEDLRSHPRGFVKGDNYDTGEVVNQDIRHRGVFFVRPGLDTGAESSGRRHRRKTSTATARATARSSTATAGSTPPADG